MTATGTGPLSWNQNILNEKEVNEETTERQESDRDTPKPKKKLSTLVSRWERKLFCDF